MELALQSIEQSKNVTNSLGAILDEYEKDKEQITSIANFVSDKGDLIHHFATGNKSNSYLCKDIFKLKGALESLNASYWSRVMNMTDVLNCMPAQKRNEWSEMIHERKTPDFTKENVVSTLGHLISSRESFFADKVDGIFRNLSGDHVTNSPTAFRKRMIINNVMNKFEHIEYRQGEYIHDLRCVVAKLLGQKEPCHSLTSTDLYNIAKEKSFGEWHEFDGGTFKIKLYKVGTAHLEVHPEIAMKLNRVLATKYPQVIAAEKRTKESKEKIIPLRNTSISYETAYSLNELLRKLNDKNSAYFGREESSDSIEVIKFIGGYYKDGIVTFSYDPRSVLSCIVRTRCLPETKSHQYYPTKADLANFMVTWACIFNDDDVLEPSAGQGGIADLLPKRRTTCVEINEVNAEVLKSKGFNVYCEDFLRFKSDRKFSRIVMNPPFNNGQAKDHVAKAFKLLDNDGILVACLPASFVNKEVIKGVDHEWSDVFEEQFDNTSVKVVILKLRK